MALGLHLPILTNGARRPCVAFVAAGMGLPPQGDRWPTSMRPSLSTCIAIQRRKSALAVIPSRLAWSLIRACCSSVRVNERGEVFSPVFVCSRMVDRESDIIYYLRHAPRFPGGKRFVSDSLTASQRPCVGSMTNKCGGGYAASRQELTAPGGEAPHSLYAAALPPKRRGGEGRYCSKAFFDSFGIMSRARRTRMCIECGHLTPKPTVSNVCRVCGGSLRVVLDD